MRYRKSNEMLKRALKVIPLASQTFSKSIAQIPAGVSPLFIERGKGSKVWDVDGNEYIDFVNGLLSISIGYCDDELNDEIVRQLNMGVNFSMPHRLETEVSELIVKTIPCAEMVRFGKNGTDSTSAAIRLARAYTGKEHVLVCGYHGWQDWYIGSTARNLGVPECVRKLTHTFEYNNPKSLADLFRVYKNQIAAVIMEPMNIRWPKHQFLEEVRSITNRNKAVLIFDETISGFRFSKGGAQELFSVIPDIATVGKGMANGFPLSAVVGKTEIMKSMEDIFYSGTFGGEVISLAAAKMVLLKVINDDVVTRIYETGVLILDNVRRLIKKHGCSNYLDISGHPSWTHLLVSDTNNCTKWEIKTLFMQEMFKRSILISGSHNVSYAHTKQDVELLINSYDQVLPIIHKAVSGDMMGALLKVEPIKPLFQVRK